ncbi:MAG: hypothetical protein WKF89_04605 [Chitinophagaceae bacterium]
MKLLRFGPEGQEKTGIIKDGIIYDASGFGEDYGESFFCTHGIHRLLCLL